MLRGGGRTGRIVTQRRSSWTLHDQQQHATGSRTLPAARSESTSTVESLRDAIKGQLVLAPLTKGNNLPFRRLCADYDAKVLYRHVLDTTLAL